MKRIIAICLLAVGIIGFIYGNTSASKKELLEKSYTKAGQHQASFTVESGSEYTARLWVTDEESGLQRWAKATASLQLIDDTGKVMFNKGATASQQSSQNDPGPARAQNGVTHRWTPTASGKVDSIVTLKEGDKAELTVYKDMSETQGMVPGLSIIVAIVGGVMLLRARNEATQPKPA